MNRWQLIQTALLSPDEEVRLGGLRSLYHYDGEVRFDLISAALGDTSWRIRKEAVNLFLSLPQALSFAERIVALLYDEENAGLRNAAAEILTRLGSAALPVLLRSVDSPDPDVRKFLLDILGDIGDRRATPLLLRLLQDDAEANVRAAAAENLGKIRDPLVVPAMVNVLSASDLLVQFSLLDALGRIGSPVPVARLAVLADNPLLRKPLFDAYGRIGDERAVAPLLAGLQEAQRHLREAALLALQGLISRYGEDLLAGNLTETAEEAVAALLASPALPVQRTAVAILGRYGDRERALSLAAYLDNDQLADDVAAIFARRGHEVVAGLCGCWSGASDKKKAYLAYLFASAGVESAAALLADELREADDFLRAILLRALGQIGRRADITTLAGYLEVPEDEVREAAVDALVTAAERYHSPVIDLVRGAFAHADPMIRKAALQVMGRLGGAESEAALLMAMKDESALVRRTAIYYLDGYNPQHYPALTLALTDEEGDVRCQAIESLAISGDRSLIAPLSLVLKDADPWVRATAVRALGRFSGNEALAAVRSGLRDPVGLVTIAALETVIEEDLPLSPGEAAASLDHVDDDVVLVLLKFLAASSDRLWLLPWAERLLGHRHWQVRQRAAELLGRDGSTEAKLLLQQRLLVEEEEMVRDALRQGLALFTVDGESL